MPVAEDLDRATDSQWDWVAEHTRTYLASGGTAPTRSTNRGPRERRRAHPRARHHREIPIVLLTPLDGPEAPGPRTPTGATLA